MRKFPRGLFFREVEMQAKRLLSCGFAFLLVLAFAGVSWAQVAVSDPQGMWIRGVGAVGYARIGQTVKINGNTLRSLAAGDVISLQITQPDGDDDGTAPDLVEGDSHLISHTLDADNIAATVAAPDTSTIGPSSFVTVRRGVGDNNYTEFGFHFVVETTDEILERNDLSVQFSITRDGTALTVHSMTTDKQILPGSTGFSTEKVGEGKTFGIDNRRPVHGNTFTSVRLVTSKGANIDGARPSIVDPNDDTALILNPELNEIKEGDEVNVSLTLDTGGLIGSNAAKVSVIFVKEVLKIGTDGADALVAGTEPALLDSAIEDATVTFTDLYAAQPLKKSVNTGEGVFGDGMRVRAFAFLQDAAGNLGAATQATGAPAGDDGGHHVDDDEDPATDADNDLVGLDLDGTTTHVADDATDDPESVNLFQIDTTTPTVTVAYPKSGATDSTHVSAKKAQELSYYSDADGTRGPNNRSSLLRPVTLKISEAVDSIKVSHGDSTATYITANENRDGLPEDVTKANFTLALPEWNYKDGEAGISKKLVVTAWDVVGNDMKVENAGITYDAVAPEVTNLFPTADNAPKDDSDNPTITAQTWLPIFTNSEDLDSMFVQYVQKDAVPADEASQPFGGTKEELKAGRVRPAIDDTLKDGVDYFLQIIAFDKAGNGSATVTEALRFKDEFDNPVADSFMVATAVEDLVSVITGAKLDLDLTALDSAQTAAEGANVRGVTYGQKGEKSRVRLEVSEDQMDRLEGVGFEGTGVSIAPADTGMGIATLDSESWEAGERSVSITSEMTLTGVMVVVEDLDAQGDVSFSTTLGPFTFDSGVFAQFTVQAMEDGEATDNVIGDFQISVTATDKFGNPSMKRSDTIDSKLDTDDFVNADGLYKTIAIELSSSHSQVTVPGGRQEIVAGENTFDAVAADASGQVVIRVFSSDPAGAGTDTLNFGTEPPPPPPGAPGAPASLMVEDYKGPTGEGDQGGMVIVTFPNSADHATVDKYQIFREISVTVTSEDSLGNPVATDSTTKAWVPWAALSQEDPNGNPQRAVIPALDNVATNWAVAAIGVGGSSGQTSATAKRVFTKESVQQTLALLGMPEAELLTDDELVNQFNAPEDYVKSVIGDQKNLVFAPVNPDVSVLLGNGSVPSNIRTSSDGGGLASARTATEKPAGARDDIAPAAATDAAGALGSDGEAGQVTLSWAVSADDGRIVDVISYRGYGVPIYGLKGYRVLRGTLGDEAPQVIGTVGVGSTEFVDMNLPDGAFTLTYRIDALDDNNATPGEMITVYNIANRAKFVDAEGEPVYLVVLPPVGDLEVNFEDFIAFSAAFGSAKGDENYNVQADVNDDGMVDFQDFLAASASFGRTVAAPANKVAVLPQRPGLNADTEMRLELTSEKVLVGETISVTVSMANARALNGYGLELLYDADKFEFVSAVPAEKDLLKSDGGETPLFKNWPEEGRVAVVNAIIESGSVSGEGALVTFNFKVLREFEDSARFEIAQGVVFDPDRLSNPVVTLGALDVQSTPTEFALHQNYPNPFNPQTNIPYDLAEGGDVVLRIYNLLGQVVRTLVRERQAPGRYSVQWSGMDDRGVSVSSGIYFYQVSVAGKFQDAKRLMLLK